MERRPLVSQKLVWILVPMLVAAFLLGRNLFLQRRAFTRAEHLRTLVKIENMVITGPDRFDPKLIDHYRRISRRHDFPAPRRRAWFLYRLFEWSRPLFWAEALESLQARRVRRDPKRSALFRELLARRFTVKALGYIWPGVRDRTTAWSPAVDLAAWRRALDQQLANIAARRAVGRMRIGRPGAWDVVTGMFRAVRVLGEAEIRRRLNQSQRALKILRRLWNLDRPGP
ncbi:MAG: hypothetical protein KJ621_16610 [Proteobacteria bacterium]|nr:hypothetical protein [Pseudomonadota bacterium]MBU1743099.1 hypothetical protein [Pseudomonadota bacterium]